MDTAFALLARLKALRGTWADPFAYGADRKLEVSLIGWYEDLLRRVPARVTPDTVDSMRAVLEAPMDIRGYGPVKEKAAEEVRARVDTLLAEPG